MNGRVYDPDIAQFAAPDPQTQSPGLTQNYSKYAYVLNNPLRYTDPSGFFFKSLFKAVGDFFGAVFSPLAKAFEWVKKNWRTVVVVVVAVAITVVSGGTLGPIAAGMLAGAISAGLNVALYGGSLSDVLHASVRGAVFGGISAGLAAGVGELGLSAYGAAAAHGVSQGGLNAMQGGDFWQGFASAAFSSLAGSYVESSPRLQQSSLATKAAIGAVSGGTASVIGGGKFENGAITGAFVVVFNHAAHPDNDRAPEPDPYSLDDAFEGGISINVGSSVGVGPKLYDVFGDPKPGFSTSCCGGGPGFGSDTIFGGPPLTPNVGLSLPGQLGSISYGGTVHNYNLMTSTAVRLGPIEASPYLNVNLPRLYQRIEQSIYRLYQVPYQ
jgi:hypothetical protein